MSISQTLFKIMILLALLISAASLNLPAYATSSTVNMNVTANISATCSMSNTDLDFGDYDATGINSSRDLLATATILTTCTSGTNGVITMSQGDHFLYCEVNDCHRQLSNDEETSTLRYNIYTDENLNFSDIWNHDVDEMSSVAQVVGNGLSQDMTVYGKIPKNQKYAAAGSYSDTITITLTY
jgi:spore coat protein U-like protein